MDSGHQCPAMSVILYQRQGPIGLVTINRPSVRNALNPEAAYTLARTWERIHDDDEVTPIRLEPLDVAASPSLE